VRVYAVGATGYQESAPVTVAAFGPSATGLTQSSGTWTTGTVNAGNPVDWYSFTATGGTYNVKWDDRVSGSGTYTNANGGGDIEVTAYKDDGSELFPRADTAYATPQTISGYSGTVYLKVRPWNGSSTYYGDYAIQYY
jgi:hypothetical protein